MRQIVIDTYTYIYMYIYSNNTNTYIHNNTYTILVVNSYEYQLYVLHSHCIENIHTFFSITTSYFVIVLDIQIISFLYYRKQFYDNIYIYTLLSYSYRICSQNIFFYSRNMIYDIFLFIEYEYEYSYYIILYRILTITILVIITF